MNSDLEKPLAGADRSRTGNPGLRDFSWRLKALFVLALAMLLGCGVWLYVVQEQHMRQAAEAELETVANLKVNQITDWRAQQLLEGTKVMDSPSLSKVVARWMAQPQPETGEVIAKRFQKLNEGSAYTDVMLVDTNGRVCLALDTNLTPLCPEEARWLAVALHDHKVVLTDLHTDDDPTPHIDIVAPIYSGEGAATRPVGAVFLESEPRQHIYPLIQKWPIPSRSAETVLVRRDGENLLFLNDLRFQTNTALKLRIPLSRTNVPGVMAVSGREGFVQGVDYRGNKVVAVLKAVPDSPWFMVTKMDAAEAFGDWHAYSVLLQALLLVLVILLGMVVLVVWQQNQKAHYRRLYEAETARRESEYFFKESQRAAFVGSYKTDFITGNWESSEVLDQIFGIGPGYEKKVQGWLKIVHPDDREMMDRYLREEVVQARQPFNKEYRIVRKSDGKTRWVYGLGKVTVDAAGRAVSLTGTIQDITERKQAEQSLMDALNFNRTIFDASTIAILTYKATGEAVSVNEGAAKIAGGTVEGLLTQNFRQLESWKEAGMLEAAEQALATGITQTLETKTVSTFGKHMWMAARFSRFTHGGEPHLLMLGMDVTDRRQAEEALRNSHALLAAALESTADGLLVVDAAGRVESFNRRFAELWRIPESLAVAKDDAQLTRFVLDQLVDPAGFLAQVQEVHRHPEKNTKDELVLRDGRVFERYSQPQRIGYTVAGRVWSFRDITERKRALQEAERGTREWQTTFDATNDAIWITDREQRVLRFNKTAERLFSRPGNELIGQFCWTNALSDSEPDLQDPFILARESGHRETQELKENGHWFEVIVDPVLDAAGQFVGAVHIVSDITERKQAEKALLESRILYHSFVDQLPAAAFRKDREGRYVMVNPRYCQLKGLKAEEMLGKTSIEVGVLEKARGLASEQAAEYSFLGNEFHRHIMHTGKPVETEEEYPEADGLSRLMQVVRMPVLDADGKVAGTQGIMMDVTARARAEEQIRYQAAILDAANDAIYIRALDHTVTYWNQGAERLYGWTRAEVMGRKITEMGSGDMAVFTEAHAALLEHGNWAGELKRIGKEGKEFIIFCRWTLLRDGQGRPREVLAINTDITEQKQLEAQLLRAQRLQSIGSLAGGVAHDLNNILTPILMNASLLRETIADPESRELIDSVENCAQRGADIIKQLLTFARGKPGVRAPVPVRHLLNETDKLIRETFPRNIRVQVNAPAELWPILGDATQIHQALLNLCVNARDALPEGGELSLAAANIILDAAFVAANPEAKPGPYVCLSVADTGTGIRPADLDRIFDPFFTTKEVGKGTGLGLATVLGVVRGHGGFVRVDSRVGSGTTFKLYLPASPASPETPAVARPASAARGTGELVLVVDDEESIRGGLQRLLQQHGYRVLTACEGGEALVLFTGRRAEIRVVLTDMVMPGMDGPTLVQTLRGLEPRLPILGMTGLAQWAGIKGLENLDLPVVLKKPFPSNELLEALARTLAAGRPVAGPITGG